jgi:hypothetical protein
MPEGPNRHLPAKCWAGEGCVDSARKAIPYLTCQGWNDGIETGDPAHLLDLFLLPFRIQKAYPWTHKTVRLPGIEMHIEMPFDMHYETDGAGDPPPLLQGGGRLP